jgi:hypothetical protein
LIFLIRKETFLLKRERERERIKNKGRILVGGTKWCVFVRKK